MMRTPAHKRGMTISFAVVLLMATALVGAKLSHGPEAAAIPVNAPVGTTLSSLDIRPDERAQIEQMKGLTPSETQFVGPAYLLVSFGDTAFYRLVDAVGNSCYSYGRAPSATDFRFGMVACDPAFPGKHPFLDLSLYEVASDQPDISRGRFIWIEGVAADGVTSISARSATGAELARVPVSNNTYKLADLPVEPVTSLAALDGAGHVVAVEDPLAHK